MNIYMLVRFLIEDRIIRKKRCSANVYQCRRDIARQFWYPQRIPVICCFVTLSIIYRLDLVDKIDLWMIYLQSEHVRAAIEAFVLLWNVC